MAGWAPAGSLPAGSAPLAAESAEPEDEINWRQFIVHSLPWPHYTNQRTERQYVALASYEVIPPFPEEPEPEPEPEEPPPPTPSGGVGAPGRGGFSSAWRKHFERQRERLEGRIEELPRKKDRAAAKASAEAIRRAIDEIATKRPDYYSARLSGALDGVLDATGPRQIVRSARAAAEVAKAEMELVDALMASLEGVRIAREQQDRMDRDVAAALLLLS